MKFGNFSIRDSLTLGLGAPPKLVVTASQIRAAQIGMQKPGDPDQFSASGPVAEFVAD